MQICEGVNWGISRLKPVFEAKAGGLMMCWAFLREVRRDWISAPLLPLKGLHTGHNPTRLERSLAAEGHHCIQPPLHAKMPRSDDADCEIAEKQPAFLLPPLFEQ